MRRVRRSLLKSMLVRRMRQLYVVCVITVIRILVRIEFRSKFCYCYFF